MIFSKKFLIIAPHPDDEILGCGGLISKIKSNKGNVSILTVCNHMPPLYSEKDSIKTLNEMKKVHKFLKIDKSINLKYPACMLHKEDQYIINNLILNVIKKQKPNYVFIPFPDRHLDHKIVYESSMVATRPKFDMSFIKSVYTYEVLSETFWNSGYIEANFIPDTFVDIKKHLRNKIKSLKFFKSQVNSKYFERSVEAVNALSLVRGSQNGYTNAEAFKLIRSRID